jgi:hypothetical protein
VKDVVVETASAAATQVGTTAHKLGVAVGVTSPTAEERAAMAAQGRTYNESTKTWSEAVTEQAAKVKETVADAAHRAGVAVGAVEPTVADKARDAKNAASNTAQRAAADTKQAANTAASTTSTLASKAKETASDAKDAVADAAHKAGVAVGVASPTLTEKAIDAKDAVANTAHKVGVAVGVSEPTAADKARDAKHDLKDAVYHGIDAMQRTGAAGELDKASAKQAGNRAYADLTDAANKAGVGAKQAVVKAADTMQRNAKPAKENIVKVCAMCVRLRVHHRC